MTLEMMSEKVISDWPKTDMKSQEKKKPPQKWCWPSRVRVKEKGNAWPTWNSHYNISMFSRARTFLQESSSKPRPLSQSWPPPGLIPGRLAPWAHLAIMHTQCIMCSMTEVRNRWPTYLLYLACMVFRNMDLLLTFKNQELSLKNADFWFLRKAERCDNCWVCIPMQRQLARGEKELPPSVGPLVPGYQQLCCRLPLILGTCPVSICELRERPKGRQGVCPASFRKWCPEHKISDSWIVPAISILHLQRSLHISCKKYS